MSKFEMTREGYKEALAYLRDIKQEHLIEKQLSTDGFTVVALANSFYADNEQK
tara:strand:+ start:1512 stop:1670 length:159 start_codon:yes stop_codon:yes gene_type:complete